MYLHIQSMDKICDLATSVALPLDTLKGRELEANLEDSHKEHKQTVPFSNWIYSLKIFYLESS